MRFASHRRRYADLILAALFAVFLSTCAPRLSPWSPEVDEMYKRMYGPIIDGGG
jgi:hypothetical protein